MGNYIKGLCVALLLTVFINFFQYPVFAETNLIESKVVEYSSTISYSEYVQKYETSEKPGNQIVVPLFDSYTADGMQTEVVDNFAETGKKAIKTGKAGSLSMKVNVPESGLYRMELTYYPLEGSGASIVRKIRIDGESPYAEAETVEFQRIWIDKDDYSTDKLGNDNMPMQVESPRFETVFASDNTGASEQPLLFYFSGGEHTISLDSVREPMAISDFRLVPEAGLNSYREVLSEYRKKGYKPAGKELIVEAEKASGKSDATMYPLNDRTSPLTVPSSYRQIKNNTIGGSQWEQQGQWIEWEIDVPEDGLYTVSLRYRQKLKSNGVSYRKLYIDGNIPFEEAQKIEFTYGSGFKAMTLGEKNNPWQFYFSKGSHTLKLEVTVGEFSGVLSKTNQTVIDLNAVYRTILMITGPSPDLYRDYSFHKMIPDTINQMSSLAKKLDEIDREICRITGSNSSQDTAVIRRLKRNLEGMVADDATIAERLNDFQNNISSLAAWVLEAKQQPLELDYIVVSGKDKPAVKGEAGLFQNVKFQLLQFIVSFVIDYNDIGDSKEVYQKSTTVWIQTGRDQTKVIRQLINEGFTTEKKINVNLQLVASGSLLPAIIANQGPDCVLQLAQSEPLNYAIRDAVVDLSQFDGIDEVKKRFSDSALIPFAYKDSLYALPESQSFQMLFYRKDILSNLKIKEADLDTWDGILKSVLPELQKNYLSFGLLPNLNNYAVMLYQNNGSLYNKTADETLLNSVNSVKAFTRFTELYTDYQQPIAFDFANRFRTGQMPLAVMDFTAYNQLSVFAPEIKGLWGVRKVPGTIQADGSIDYTATSTVSGCVILTGAKDRQSAWEFLKWWTSDNTQTAYGRNLESIMGTAARYNSANLNAFNSLAWDGDMGKQLYEQRQSVKAIPEVPGGYYTSRYFDFAFRDVVINKNEIREILDNSTKQINSEIKNKREEFKLD